MKWHKFSEEKPTKRGKYLACIDDCNGNVYNICNYSVLTKAFYKPSNDETGDFPVDVIAWTEFEEFKKESPKMSQFYIVRGNNSGVFFGNIKERKGMEVTMTNVRRIWYWDGAASISQLAQEGTVAPQNCKFTVAVDEILVLDAIEIDACTEEAVNSIQGVAVWKC